MGFPCEHGDVCVGQVLVPLGSARGWLGQAGLPSHISFIVTGWSTVDLVRQVGI